MNERKMNLGKIAMVGGMMAMTAMLSAIMMTGCGLRLSTKDRENCQYGRFGGNGGFRAEAYIQRGRAGSTR